MDFIRKTTPISHRNFSWNISLRIIHRRKSCLLEYANEILGFKWKKFYRIVHFYNLFIYLLMFYLHMVGNLVWILKKCHNLTCIPKKFCLQKLSCLESRRLTPRGMKLNFYLYFINISNATLGPKINRIGVMVVQI